MFALLVIYQSDCRQFYFDATTVAVIDLTVLVLHQTVDNKLIFVAKIAIRIVVFGTKHNKYLVFVATVFASAVKGDLVVVGTLDVVG